MTRADQVPLPWWILFGQEQGPGMEGPSKTKAAPVDMDQWVDTQSPCFGCGVPIIHRAKFGLRPGNADRGMHEMAFRFSS